MVSSSATSIVLGKSSQSQRLAKTYANYIRSIAECQTFLKQLIEPLEICTQYLRDASRALAVLPPSYSDITHCISSLRHLSLQLSDAACAIEIAVRSAEDFSSSLSLSENQDDEQPSRLLQQHQPASASVVQERLHIDKVLGKVLSCSDSIAKCAVETDSWFQKLQSNHAVTWM
jgi:hypothetical protein